MNDQNTRAEEQAKLKITADTLKAWILPEYWTDIARFAERSFPADGDNPDLRMVKAVCMLSVFEIHRMAEEKKRKK